jgi:hypothetical protein
MGAVAGKGARYRFAYACACPRDQNPPCLHVVHMSALLSYVGAWYGITNAQRKPRPNRPDFPGSSEELT